MNNIDNFAIIFVTIGVLFPLFLYVVAGFWIKKSRDYRDFFLADRKVSPTEFVDTTVAYGFQIAALSLFVLWGYQHGIWTIWVPIFWGVGYFLFARLVERGRLDSILRGTGINTIHEYLGKTYSFPFLAVLATFATLLGLSGTALFEAEFISDLLVNLSPSPTEGVKYVIFLTFLLSGTAYILAGGLRSVVRTDAIQLSIGYIGFLVITCWALAKTRQLGMEVPFIVFGFFLILATWVLFFTSKKIQKRIQYTLLFGAIVATAGIIWGFTLTPETALSKSFTKFATEQKLYSPLGLGVISLFSLLLANTLWQIVDISNWQRSLAFDIGKNTDEAFEKAKRSLAKNLRWAGLYSPVTWIIIIIFGCSIRYIGYSLPNEWTLLQDITKKLLLGSLLEQVILGVFFLATVSIMLSTIDSLITAISFTVHNDWLRGWGRKESKLGLNLARMVTVLFVISVFMLYIMARQYIKQFDVWIYAFYSSQLALLPSIICGLYYRRLNKIAAVVSILSGLVAIVITVKISELDPYVVSPISALVASILGYILFSFFSRWNVEKPS